MVEERTVVLTNIFSLESSPVHIFSFRHWRRRQGDGNRELWGSGLCGRCFPRSVSHPPFRERCSTTFLSLHSGHVTGLQSMKFEGRCASPPGLAHKDLGATLAPFSHVLAEWKGL